MPLKKSHLVYPAVLVYHDIKIHGFIQISFAKCDVLHGRQRKACFESLNGLNTCYSGAIRALNAGDTLKISYDGNVIAGATDTFFGLAAT